MVDTKAWSGEIEIRSGALAPGRPPSRAARDRLGRRGDGHRRAAARAQPQDDPPGDLLRARGADLRLGRRRDDLLDREHRHLPDLEPAGARRVADDPHRGGRCRSRCSARARGCHPRWCRTAATPRCPLPRRASAPRPKRLPRAPLPEPVRIIAPHRSRGRGGRLAFQFDLPARLGDLGASAAHRVVAPTEPWVRRSRSPASAAGRRSSHRRDTDGDPFEAARRQGHPGAPAGRRTCLRAQHRRQVVEVARRRERRDDRHLRGDLQQRPGVHQRARRRGAAGHDHALGAAADERSRGLRGAAWRPGGEVPPEGRPRPADDLRWSMD